MLSFFFPLIVFKSCISSSSLLQLQIRSKELSVSTNRCPKICVAGVLAAHPSYTDHAVLWQHSAASCSWGAVAQDWILCFRNSFQQKNTSDIKAPCPPPPVFFTLCWQKNLLPMKNSDQKAFPILVKARKLPLGSNSFSHMWFEIYLLPLISLPWLDVPRSS